MEKNESSTRLLVKILVHKGQTSKYLQLILCRVFQLYKDLVFSVFASSVELNVGLFIVRTLGYNKLFREGVQLTKNVSLKF